MEEEDWYGFGSFKDMFSLPDAMDNTHPPIGVQENNATQTIHSTKSSPASSPLVQDYTRIATQMYTNGLLVPENKLNLQKKDDVSFHAQHIRLKIQYDSMSKMRNFNIIQTNKSTIAIGTDFTAVGELFICKKRLIWKPNRHSDSGNTQKEGMQLVCLCVQQQHIRSVEKAMVQNIVQAIIFKVHDANSIITFQIAFMPGPFFKNTKRDELFDALFKSKSNNNEAHPNTSITEWNEGKTETTLKSYHNKTKTIYDISKEATMNSKSISQILHFQNEVTGINY